MADPSDSRTVAYMQQAREARGLPARRPTAAEVREQREQRALFQFEAAFSGWVSDRSALLRQHREAFVREQTCPWRPNAFAQWLPDDARAEVCAKLVALRSVFALELGAAAEMRVTPNVMAALGRIAGEFVRRAQSRRHPHDYQEARTRARGEAKRRVERVHDRVRDLVTALALLHGGKRTLSCPIS